MKACVVAQTRHTMPYFIVNLQYGATVELL
jgi:hypothetical protein